LEIFLVRPDAVHFQSLECLEDDQLQIAYRFNGNPTERPWRTVRFSWVAESRSDGQLQSDFPAWLYHVPIFSERAINALLDLLTDSGETLPIDCSGQRYFALNVTRVIEALDSEQTVFERFASSGRISGISHYHFIPSTIGDASIFKLPYVAPSDVFVTDRFVARTKDFNLTGFLFQRLWPASSP
jgi:hypothetical protein